jgi:hypothetical protein
MKKFKKLSDEMEQKVDKFINEECGGWETKPSKYDVHREDILSGKMKLTEYEKQSFKAHERIRRLFN